MSNSTIPLLVIAGVGIYLYTTQHAQPNTEILKDPLIQGETTDINKHQLPIEQPIVLLPPIQSQQGFIVNMPHNSLKDKPYIVHSDIYGFHDVRKELPAPTKAYPQPIKLSRY